MDKNFELVKEKDEEINLGAHKWYGSEDQTAESEMHDKGKGEPIVLRLFEFKLNPTLERPPTKEEILTPEYIKHLSTLLWADSLRLVTTPEVRIDKDAIRIFAACQARTGATLTEEPKMLQEWIK
jgi:hypothetical protein